MVIHELIGSEICISIHKVDTADTIAFEACGNVVHLCYWPGFTVTSSALGKWPQSHQKIEKCPSISSGGFVEVLPNKLRIALSGNCFLARAPDDIVQKSACTVKNHVVVFS